MPNDDIKVFMRKRGIFVYEVASELGIGEASLYRWFRQPLEGDRRERVITAIRACAERQNQLVL